MEGAIPKVIVTSPLPDPMREKEGEDPWDQSAEHIIVQLY